MRALLDLLDEHEEPIAYDLIRLGLRLRDLGTDRLSWGDLWAIVRNAPRDSALYRALNPDHEWTLTDLLLAEVADAVRVANWQRGSAKRHEYPKPIPRPGVEPQSATYGKGAIPIDEMAEWLGWDT